LIPKEMISCNKVIINVKKIIPIGRERRKYSQLGTNGKYLAIGYKITPKKVIYKIRLRYFLVL
jgi:hypothetical protein